MQVAPRGREAEARLQVIAAERLAEAEDAFRANQESTWYLEA